MRDKDMVVRRAATQANAYASGFGDHAPALVDRLIELLEDKDKEVAILAVRGLIFGRHPNYTKARRVLIQKSKKGKLHIREEAIRALGNTARRDKEFVPQVLPLLLATLKDPKQELSTRKAAAEAIFVIGPEAKQAAPALLQVLKQPNVRDPKQASSLRMDVMNTLAELGPGARPAIPHLLKVLLDDKRSWDERMHALKPMRTVGDAANVAIPTLNKLLKEMQAVRHDPATPQEKATEAVAVVSDLEGALRVIKGGK
jgi:HEAT repeat protein